MSVTLKEVEQLSSLARINLSANEQEFYAEQLNLLLNYVDKINQIDTEGIEAMEQLRPVFNVFRADEVVVSPSRDEMLSNAALTEEGHFKVPRII